jgi:hypothetical protein
VISSAAGDVRGLSVAALPVSAGPGARRFDRPTRVRRQLHANPTGDYASYFYRRLAGKRWKARLDLEVECEHRDFQSGSGLPVSFTRDTVGLT